MNKVILMGRLTRDPDVRYSAGENATAVARYTLAVDRRFKRDGDATADFIGCVAFGRRRSLQRNICARERRLPSPAASRPEAIPTAKARRFIQQTLLLRNRNLRRARVQASTTAADTLRLTIPRLHLHRRLLPVIWAAFPQMGL